MVCSAVSSARGFSSSVFVETLMTSLTPALTTLGTDYTTAVQHIRQDMCERESRLAHDTLCGPLTIQSVDGMANLVSSHMPNNRAHLYPCSTFIPGTHRTLARCQSCPKVVRCSRRKPEG